MAFDLDEDPTQAASESSDIIAGMPEPQQHAIDAAALEDETNAGPTGEAQADSAGEAWNPAIHSTGADGSGIKTAKGTWRRRRGAGAGPRRQSQVVRPADNSSTLQAEANSAALIAQARAAGAAAAASIFMMGRCFGGEDWAPSADEVTLQTDAWGNYFVAKGVTDFPPGLALSIAVLGYAGPRFFTPKTKERVGTIKMWFAIRVARHKVKKALKKRGIVASVTIAGSQSANAYDSLLINGKPFNEYPDIK